MIDGDKIRLALYDQSGKEIIRHNPFSVMVTRDDVKGDDIVPVLLAKIEKNVNNQLDLGLKEFLLQRVDFRNKILYATDVGTIAMGDTLDELMIMFRKIFSDLLWVLALLVGGEPPSKEWGLVSQVIGIYREALIAAGILRHDNTITEAIANLA